MSKHDDGGPTPSPCPFGCEDCGDHGIIPAKGFVVESRSAGGPWYHIECPFGCRGPERGQEGQAVTAWNAVADAMLRARRAGEEE